MTEAVSNKSKSVIVRINARIDCNGSKLMLALILFIINLALNSRGSVIRASSRDLARFRELLMLLGIRKLTVQDRAAILKALRRIARAYGVGEAYMNNTHYVILDARRLRSMQPEELARELARIICEEGDGDGR